MQSRRGALPSSWRRQEAQCDPARPQTVCVSFIASAFWQRDFCNIAVAFRQRIAVSPHIFGFSLIGAKARFRLSLLRSLKRTAMTAATTSRYAKCVIPCILHQSEKSTSFCAKYVILRKAGSRSILFGGTTGTDDTPDATVRLFPKLQTS